MIEFVPIGLYIQKGVINTAWPARKGMAFANTMYSAIRPAMVDLRVTQAWCVKLGCCISITDYSPILARRTGE